MSTGLQQTDHEQLALPPDAPRVALTAAGSEGPVRCAADQPITMIGSRRDCQLPLQHPDVSKVHGAIVNTGRAILVCDLCSRSGTFVNDESVRVAELRPGDRLRVGPVDVQVEFSTPPQADTTAETADFASRLTLCGANGEAYEIDGTVTLIGRRKGCHVMLDSPDVSLAHALLFALDGQPAVCDLGSRSGTLLNGERATLAWVRDGDVMGVGGLELSVAWAPPSTSVRKAAVDASPTLPVTPAASESPVALDLEDIEQSIAVLHGHIAASRAKLNERSAALEQREAELTAWAAEVDEQGRTLRQSEQTLEQRASELEQAEQATRQKLAAAIEREKAAETQTAEQARLAAEIEAQQNELAEQASQLVGEKEQLAALRTQLEAGTSQLQEEREEFARQRLEWESAAQELEQTSVALEERELAVAAESDELRRQKELVSGQQAQIEMEAAQTKEKQEALQAERQQLERRRAEVEQAAAAFDEREAGFIEREAALVARETQLQAAAAELEQRTATGAAAVDKIERFKAALQEATAMFAGADLPRLEMPATSKPDERGDRAARTPQPAEPRVAADAQAEQVPSANVGESELPAPMVDQPIFNTDGGGVPSDWPPEVRERFQVLRRVSNKSDAELVVQLQAEYTSRERAGADGRKGDRKKQRRWWV
ncbi:MAG: FHA domain-containing protein [Planctomycetes bacterium]|nr:FHA domain-containing protein [Planctomycetota bacterium]